MVAAVAASTNAPWKSAERRRPYPAAMQACCVEVPTEFITGWKITRTDCNTRNMRLARIFTETSGFIGDSEEHQLPTTGLRALTQSGEQFQPGIAIGRVHTELFLVGENGPDRVAPRTPINA